MKQYKNIQKQFSLVGIDFNQSKCSREKAKRSFLIYGLAITSSVIFLAFEAKTLDEFANNVYITSATVMVYIFYAILVIKSDKLFEFIAKGEKFIDQSKWFFKKKFNEINLVQWKCNDAVAVL